MLSSRLGSFEGLRVADLFAGSGALGLEALSRGAASATFVERDPQAVATIRHNAEKLEALGRINVVLGSALELEQSEPFDVIFADPPYAAGLANGVVSSVETGGWLAPTGWLSIETGLREIIDPGALMLASTRDVGRARLTLLRRP
jgi:16S rRNA (guanine966-N2)-methyltransferase